MATRTVVCPGCDAPVEPGRYACPACGTLLVALAGAARPMTGAAPTAALSAEPATTAEPTQPAEPMPEATAAPMSTAEATVEPADAVEQAAAVEPAEPADEPAAEAAQASPAWPAAPAWPPAIPDTGPQPRHLDPGVRVPAGSYLPPSAVLPPVEALPLHAPNGASSDARQALAPAPDAATGHASDWVASLPGDTPSRLIAGGAAIAGLGFLLPWSEVIVGSGQFGGYTAQWGLAGPAHLVVLALLAAVGGLALASERLPRRVGPGLPAVAIGALLFGLVWPYLFSVLGAHVGSWVVVAGAATLAAGGALDVRARSHARPEPVV